MRNRVLFVCVLVFWLCGAGCSTRSKKPVVVDKPVYIPPSRILTLSEQQLFSLDFYSPNPMGARVEGKSVVAGPGVEFDIYFPSNSPGSRSLNLVSSGEGGIGTLVGADISGYEEFALKLTLVSINGQSGPGLKQQIVAGAVIGPTATRQPSTYEPVTLGLAASEKTVIAKTSGLTDRIYQIGFHVHMLNPQDWDPSGSMLRLRVEPVENGQLGVAPAVVAIEVAPNRLPVADSDSVTTMEDTPVEISLMGSDPDSDPLVYSTVAGPSHGSLSGTAPNLTYTPNTNFNGSDSFAFKVNDGTMDSVPATASITVSPVNDPPVANSDAMVTQEDTPVDISLMGSDPDSDPLVYSTVAGPSHGSLSGTAPNLTYTPNTNFNGSDSFAFKVNDGTMDSVPATASITVSPVNDPPVITSAPVTAVEVGALYTYDVNATDPDMGDTLTYSLTAKPTGMTIEPDTGLIRWTPESAHVGTNDIVVKVVDSGDIPASDTQSFTITLNPVSLPPIITLTIADGYDQRNRRTLSTDGKTSIVQSSDNNRLETYSRSYTSYDFSDVLIPADAVITSVVVYVEHFEEERFAWGKLQWGIGTGWPTKPVVWASIIAPVHEGQRNEAIDSWDVTSFVDTPEKINSLQLQVKNNDNVANRKTLIDYIYVVVEF